MNVGKPNHVTDSHWRKIRTIDLYTLIYLSITAARNPRLGWNHADKPLNYWLGGFEQKYSWITIQNLEDALYSANMLDEIGEYYHPLDIKLNSVLSRCLKKNEIYDKKVNLILKKEIDNG